MELQAKLLDCPEDFLTFSAYCDNEMVHMAGELSGNHTILKKSHSDKEWTAMPYNFGVGTIQTMEKTEDGYLFLFSNGSGSYKLKQGDQLQKRSL